MQEALAHQKATTEVLDVISRSPTSTQPVFDAIIASAAKLCNAAFSAIELYDGKDLQYIASHNFTPEVEAKLRAKDGRYALDPRRLAHRAILMRAPVHTADVQLDPDYPVELARSGQWRALLSMPMLQQGEAVGVISVSRPEPGRSPNARSRF